MSKRLQVLLPDEEMSDLQRLASRDRVSVGEWVRRALRKARDERSTQAPHAKLNALRRGAQFEFPTGDIDQMLSEIERGYRS